MLMFSPKAKPEARQKAVAGLIADLNSNGAPILVGPWRSEVGFEASYWTALLRFLATKVKGFDRRSAVVTRGGMAPLYRDIASSGFDLYALRSVADVRRENAYDAQVRQKGKTIKQLQDTEWDQAVLEDAAKALGITGLYHTVHPAWMYWALSPFWDDQAGLRYLMSMADYAPLPKIAVDIQLPPAYVAVKFYGRATFPYPHPDIAEYVTQAVSRLAQIVPIVTLGVGNEHDDHIDIPVSGKNIFNLPQDMPAHENLRVQAAVLSHASAFVGTYGGVAQLALRLGVPSFSVYGTPWGGTSHAHYALSSWLSKSFQVPFCVQHVSESGTEGPALFAHQMLKTRAKGCVAA